VRWSKGKAPTPPPFPRANAVGMKGMVKQTDPAGGAWVEPIESVEPPDLYEAQLRKRLGSES